MTVDGTSLDVVLPALRCPVCAAPLSRAATALRCPDGHSFDVARQGYVNLTGGGRGPGTGDSAAMTAARERFLHHGHYAPIADAVSDAIRTHAPSEGLLVDIACGTGYYLARALDDDADRVGLGVDLSAPALRRAARAHPRAAAIGADAWATLPLAKSCAGVVLSVFGPRNRDEIIRVLREDGVLIVVSPRPDHLREVVAPLQLIGIDPDKDKREAATFAGLTVHAERELTYTVTLHRADVVDVVAMGPSGAHLDAAQLAERAAQLADPSDVTVSIRLRVYAAAAPAAPGR